MSKSINLNETLIKTLLYIHIVMWVLYIPITQLQLLLFGQRIITLSHLAIFELATIILLLICNLFQLKGDELVKKTILMITGLFILWILNFVIVPNVLDYWKIYYLIYWIMPYVVLTFALQKPIDMYGMKCFFLVIILLHSVMIFFQHNMNDVIWLFSIDDEGNQLFYISEGYYNTGRYMERCPGICTSGLEAGLLLIFGILLVISLHNLKKIIKTLLIILFVIAIYFTGTRNIYIQLIFVFVMTIIAKLPKLSRKNKIKLSVIATVIAMIIYLYMFNFIGDGVSTKKVITDTLSAGLRVKNWNKVLSQISEAGFVRAIFGQGVWQSAGYKLLIDNMYLELIVSSGLVGSVIYIIYIFILSKNSIKYDNTDIGYMFSSFILSSLVYGVANVLGNFFVTLIIVSIIVCKNNSIEHKRKQKKDENNN